MANSFFFLPLLFLLLNSFTLCFCSTIFNSSTDEHALVAFKTSIISGPDAILSKNWSHDTPVCNWIGVSCGLKHRRVTALNLSGYDLVGTVSPYLGNLTFLRYLDISFNNFTGLLPFELSNLHRLEVVNVGVNSFTGEIPAWLGSLPQLEQVYLFNNSFSGMIPPSLFNNPKLHILDMSANLLSGNIPEEIGNNISSSLEILNLQNNHLSGPVPWGLFNVSSMREISISDNNLLGSLPGDMCNNLLNLRLLSLSMNQLSGEIPGNIWKCRDLEFLSLSFNHFNGSIPSEIGSLSMLRVLYLGINDFQGEVPAEIGNLSRLEKLSIRQAPLTGNIPSSIFNISSLTYLTLANTSLSGWLPSDMCNNLPNIKVLYLFQNELEGQIPPSIGKCWQLEFLDLSFNKLRGNIPHGIGNLSSVREFYMAANDLTGSLPSDMGNSLFNLEWVQLRENKFSGEIPRSITNASKLSVLDVSHNSLSGFVPDFGDLRLLRILQVGWNHLRGAESPTQELTFISSLTNCRLLEYLVLWYNPFMSGILPASIGNLSTSLLFFDASYSNIRGIIPSEIGNLSSLLYLYLEGNQLTGHIPPTIGKMKNLQKMYLGGNQLVGSIPSDLCGMKSLGELELGGNMLVGAIPECLGDLTSLKIINFSLNRLNSTIPLKFWNLGDLLVLNLSSNDLSGQLSSQLASFRVIISLDLSRNQFSGDISSIIDGCESLEILHLQNNKFTGPIPQPLGKIRSLRELDLSNNSLSGLIPKSLANLTFLWYFNVSYNKLVGEIPNEGCFVNFTAQSFANNSALCGPTRFRVPPCSESHGGSRVKSFVQLMKYVVASLILVVILVIAIIILMRRRNKKKGPPSTPNILQSIEWRRISYIELERGTSSFSENNLLGTGGFGSVFKATLSDGLNVAVKVFNLQLERAARSFETESELLSTIRHRNIVHVIGCCSNMEFKALILEYMPNGSLEKWLYADNYCLDLVQRLKVAIDVALALEYLHHGYTFPVVHCDIKPSNILLDEDMTARVGDFGIAKLFDKGEDVILTNTLATIGYVAPEYGLEGKVSINGDVYSYGITLLEMFTSKKPTDDMFMGEMSLKEWASEALQKNSISEVVDPRLLDNKDQHLLAKSQCVSSIFSLAMKCVATSPTERINMIEATAALKKIKSAFEASLTRCQRYANYELA